MAWNQSAGEVAKPTPKKPSALKGAADVLRYPKKVNVVDLAPAPFKCAKEAVFWAKGHGVVGVMSDVDTNGKGVVSISIASIRKMVSVSAMSKSVTPGIHYAALMRLRDIIRESFVGEVHPDRMKKGGKRSAANGVNPDVTVLRLYGCVSFGDFPFRSKVTLKRYVDVNESPKAYSYEISNIEVLKGNAGDVPLPSDKTSMDVGILLNGVCDVNGAPLLMTSETER